MAGNDEQNYRTRFTKSGINAIRACHQESDLQKLQPFIPMLTIPLYMYKNLICLKFKSTVSNKYKKYFMKFLLKFIFVYVE